MYQQGLPLMEAQQPCHAAFSEATMSYASGKDASWLRLDPPVPSGGFVERGDNAVKKRFDKVVDKAGVRSLLIRTRVRLGRAGFAFSAC
jgi:hypothetical protein